jgi:glycine C-acetyltransferase
LVLKHDLIEKELTKLKKNSTYRNLRVVRLQETTKALVNGSKTINLSSNDYLGLSQNKYVIRETKNKLTQISQCSSRLIAGNSTEVEELEKCLAIHRKTESALVYPTGYMANLGAITTIADKNAIIFSDELNHSSIIDGCRLSGARIEVFKHNDVESLRTLMEHFDNASSSSFKNKIIVTEGVFSMDGDISTLWKICQLAQEQKAMTVLDDAHGDFIFGAQGSYSGTADFLKVTPLIDIHISSLSKGLGSFGGYIASSSIVRNLLINKSRQFIYTSAIPSHLCISSLAAIPFALKGNLQQRLFGNVLYLSRRLRKVGYLLGNSMSQIVPIIVGDERTAIKLSNSLLKSGIFVQAIRYPTVKKGAARLRISLTAGHNRNELNHVLYCLEKLGKKYGLI